MRITDIIPAHDTQPWSVGDIYPSPPGDDRAYTITEMQYDPDGMWWVVRLCLKRCDGAKGMVDLHIHSSGTYLHTEMRLTWDPHSPLSEVKL